MPRFVKGTAQPWLRHEINGALAPEVNFLQPNKEVAWTMQQICTGETPAGPAHAKSQPASAPARTAALAMRAMAVEFPPVHGHPNRLPFEGVLTLVDVASDKAPSGARGHRVVLTRAAAEAALPSLLGMAVDYKAGWDGHDARQKCGIITSAELDGRRLTVAGFVFSRDFPEIEQRLCRRRLLPKAPWA